jgi:CheY-like chemotaxis protein
VDDDLFVREMITMILEASEYEVMSVASGAEAMAKLSSAPGIALILSDMNMPEMNGSELMKKVHGQKPGLPFILLTADDDPATRTQALADGASECLVKSHDIEETVPAAIARLLQTH